MNSKVRTLIRNFSYTLSSNVISLIISTLVILVIPKLIGVGQYGYWQLYMFYTAYVGFFQFGWNDGIYLRYGGLEYKNLDKNLFHSQFWMISIFQFILAGVIILISMISSINEDKRFIIFMVAICMMVSGVRAMLLFILQATNRIKESATIIMLDRIVYCISIIIFLVLRIKEYEYMIAADLIGKFISLLYSIYYCEEIVFNGITTFYFSFKETIKNIEAGIKLMFANIASMLIIGVVRFGIEKFWNVETFGKVSLTLSISNLIMLFINALGVIIFPILKRTDEEKLSNIYITLRDFLMLILLAILVIYYPVKVLLSAWLPEYTDGLKYMALVFPMCLYEGKMALLINTYLKTLRQEKAMLQINLISLIFSLLTTYISIVALKKLDFAILTIVILLAFRCILSEIYLSKILKITIFKDIVLESILTVVFILSGWFINSPIAILIYLGAYIIYLFIKRNDITRLNINFKTFLKV